MYLDKCFKYFKDLFSIFNNSMRQLIELDSAIRNSESLDVFNKIFSKSPGLLQTLHTISSVV